jgi:hypothetical protein
MSTIKSHLYGQNSQVRVKKAQTTLIRIRKSVYIKMKFPLYIPVQYKRNRKFLHKKFFYLNKLIFNFDCEFFSGSCIQYRCRYQYWMAWRLTIARALSVSVAEPHQFYAAPAPGKNFDAAPAAPAPTLLYSMAKFLK